MGWAQQLNADPSHASCKQGHPLRGQECPLASYKLNLTKKKAGERKERKSVLNKVIKL